MTRLVLASASPARSALLTRAGITPQICVSEVDEPAALRAAEQRFGRELPPDETALFLARAKAENVAARVMAEPRNEAAGGVNGAEAALVLGCDSVLEFEGGTLGKPADATEAVTRWLGMAGKSGTLHTGHWLIDLRDEDESGTGATLGGVAATVVHFSAIDAEEIEAYVATGEPLRAAGAFTINGLGGPYIEAIEGDHTNVIGLSLPLLRELVAQLGIPWRLMRSG